MNKEKIEELKKAHPSGLYEGEISFTDGDGKQYSVAFLFRKPTMADGELYAKTTQKSIPVANINLLQSVIVHPDPGPIIEQIRDYPSAYAQFTQEVLSPFFGGNITVKSKKL